MPTPNLIAAFLGGLALCAALARRKLPRASGIILCAAAASAAGIVLAYEHHWPLTDSLARFVRLTAALALIWSVLGWVTRHNSASQTRDPDVPSRDPVFQSRDREGAVRAISEHIEPLPHGRGADMQSPAHTPFMHGEPSTGHWALGTKRLSENPSPQPFPLKGEGVIPIDTGHWALGTRHFSPHPTSTGFLTVALLCAVAAFILLCYAAITATLARTLESADALTAPLHHGVTDILTLAAAMGFWRLARRHPFQPTLLLLLAGLLAIQCALFIPGNIIGAPGYALLPVSGRPGWWTWTLCMQLGLTVALAAAAFFREKAYRLRRAGAWPNNLAHLLEPYPTWPGFPELFSMIAAADLVLVVYHLVRPGALNGLGGPIGMFTAIAAGIACLHTAHRRWNENLAGLGLALLTGAAVTLAALFVSYDPSTEYARYLPVQLNAAVLGLAPAALVLFCLADFWSQQLLGDRAWTTTGRLIPHAWRAGFLIAALAVLAGFHMALWPQTHISIAPDNSPPRWIAGLAGLSLLAVTTGWCAIRRHHILAMGGSMTVRTRDPGLAMLTIATLTAIVIFALVRWPTSDARGWTTQHASVLLAILALPVLAVAESFTKKPRAGVFAPPLWFLALLALPAVALYQSTGRQTAEWLRPLTLAALACTYALAGTREGRRAFLLLASILLIVAGISVWTIFRGNIGPIRAA